MCDANEIINANSNDVKYEHNISTPSPFQLLGLIYPFTKKNYVTKHLQVFISILNH